MNEDQNAMPIEPQRNNNIYIHFSGLLGGMVVTYRFAAAQKLDKSNAHIIKLEGMLLPHQSSPCGL
jgi:uncharacterized membrane protein YdcZ (DUF606 family)